MSINGRTAWVSEDGRTHGVIGEPVTVVRHDQAVKGVGEHLGTCAPSTSGTSARCRTRVTSVRRRRDETKVVPGASIQDCSRSRSGTSRTVRSPNEESRWTRGPTAGGPRASRRAARRPRPRSTPNRQVDRATARGSAAGGVSRPSRSSRASTVSWSRTTLIRQREVSRDFGASLRGDEPGEDLVVLLGGRSVGLLQRSRITDYPEYLEEFTQLVPVPEGAVTLDYLIGEAALRGRGVGTRLVARAVHETWTVYPDACCVLIAVVAANVASWRALEKAGLQRVAHGLMTPDNPVDESLHYVYRIDRPAHDEVREQLPKGDR